MEEAEEDEAELQRAVDALHAMKIEEEVSSSLDGAISVFKGRKKDSLVYVQVKRITKMGGEHLLPQIHNEVKILRSLPQTHARIAKFLDCYQTNKHVWLVSEYIAGTCLRDILVHTFLEFASLRALCRDMSQALLFLHKQCGIAHCDLRPENIVFTESGLAKVCGFGFAHPVQQQQMDAARDEAFMRRLRRHHYANAEYAAPEILALDARQASLTAFLGSKAADVWTFGITLFECVHGVTPFTGTSSQHVRERVLEDEPTFSTACDGRIVKLLKVLLQGDPKHRPLEDEFVAVVNKL